MSVAQTSKEAFAKIQPELNGRRLEVFDELVARGRASNQTLAYSLKWSINRVTPRINELVKLGKVECVGVERGMYGNTVKVWAPAPEKPEQLDLLDMVQDCGDE